MVQPRFLKYSAEKIVAEWPRFERWSAALTWTQLANSGITAHIINGAGGLQGDPVLQLPSIPNVYDNVYIEVRSQCALQSASGATSFPLTATNYACGLGGGVGLIVDGVINQFQYSGNYGKLYLSSIPQTLDFSALLLSYLLDPAYNNAVWPIGAVSQYMAMCFDVSLYGTR